MKRRLVFSLLVLLLHTAPANALTVTCTNCSNMIMQALERITNMEQLSTLANDYQESITQTAQQIRMVQQNIEQYQNMLQNTMRLPETLLNELKGNLTRLAHLSNNLNTLRGDIAGLGQIFLNLFPEQSLFGDLAGASKEQMQQANARYEAEWDKWAETVDKASQATFQLSGQQLADLQQDPEQFQQYIDDLLSTPEGQQQALMAGNQLAAIQVQEARQLRELMATQTQSALASQMKAEKESQMAQELWRDMNKTGNLGGLISKPDPF
jgi:P-type conjugative transfer protein TrbJ